MESIFENRKQKNYDSFALAAEGKEIEKTYT